MAKPARAARTGSSVSGPTCVVRICWLSPTKFSAPTFQFDLGPPAMRRCEHLHALRRARQKRIDVPGYFAKIFGKRNNVRIPAAEDQSFVGLHTGYAHEPMLGKIKILRKVPVECRCHEPARPLVGPAVIRANKVAHVARIRTTNLGAPMSAAVQERMHGAIAVAHHDHWGAAQASGNKISRLRNLRLMGQKDPGAIENSAPSRACILVADKDIAAHQTAPHIHPIVRSRMWSSVQPWIHLCEISLTLQISPSSVPVASSLPPLLLRPNKR